MQDCSIPIGKALEILQSYDKPSIWRPLTIIQTVVNIEQIFANWRFYRNTNIPVIKSRPRTTKCYHMSGVWFYKLRCGASRTFSVVFQWTIVGEIRWNKQCVMSSKTKNLTQSTNHKCGYIYGANLISKQQNTSSSWYRYHEDIARFLFQLIYFHKSTSISQRQIYEQIYMILPTCFFTIGSVINCIHSVSTMWTEPAVIYWYD